MRGGNGFKGVTDGCIEGQTYRSFPHSTGVSTLLGLPPKEVAFADLSPSCGSRGIQIVDLFFSQIYAPGGVTARNFYSSVTLIFVQTLLQRFSAHGEMYSCRDMKRLAEEFIPKATVEHLVDWHPDDLKTHLLKGGLALVPYDSDHHFDPDKRKGMASLDELMFCSTDAFSNQ